jgi:hypothetical protein
LIKLDIEGYEYKAFLGAVKTIKKFKPIIYIENPSIVIDKFFYSLNYKKYHYKKNTKKLSIIKKNKKDSYNYIYIYNKTIFCSNIFE